MPAGYVSTGTIKKTDEERANGMDGNTLINIAGPQR